jgi:phage terminase small subunit
MQKLDSKQKALLAAIKQELRRETALAYISSGYDNKTKAYIAACKKMKRDPSKNPETSASEILSYPNVIEFINSVKVEIAQEAKIDAAWVLNAARKVYDRCMQEEAVTDRDGSPTGEYKFEHSGANAALGIIGKHIDVQAFLDKKEVKNINAELSDEELELKIRKLTGK